jgi:arylsulfatase A-like enzyme
VNVPNAEQAYPPDNYAKVNLPASNTPLHGKKGQVYEGGIRVPALVYWPAKFKPGVVNTPIHIVDWMPTLTALAGYTPEKDLKWDGRDVWPVLAGAEKSPAARTLYWVGPGFKSSAIRHGDWKLIVQAKSTELYNLANDLNETKDLAAAEPARVAELKDLLAKTAARDRDAVAPGKAPGNAD